MDTLKNKQLNYHSVYSCPICRCGEISTLPLMEAFACNFCHHIFSADMQQNSVKVVDTQLSVTWRWDGQNWKRFNHNQVNWRWWYLAGGIAFVLIPPLLLAAAVYCFPPLPGSPLSWFPLAWTFLAFLSHLGCLLWLVLEYYQLPLGLYWRAWQQRLIRR